MRIWIYEIEIDKVKEKEKESEMYIIKLCNKLGGGVEVLNLLFNEPSDAAEYIRGKVNMDLLEKVEVIELNFEEGIMELYAEWRTLEEVDENLEEMDCR